MPGHEPAEDHPEDPGTLVVLSAGEVIAKATVWVRAVSEGQTLVAVPRLRLEQLPAMYIVAGRALPEVLHDCKLVTPHWEAPASFVGGSWVLWRTGRPFLEGVGFVIGNSFNIEHALRGLKKLLT